MKKTSLYWLKTDQGGCELNEKEIRGQATIKMIDLAFSLLRNQHPDRTIVTLLDDSGFSWKDTSGRSYKTNFLKGYLQKTWYEDKFNAVMCNPEIYRIYREKADHNFDDPSKKPVTFDFMNSEVKVILEPLYLEANTWREFINKFVEKHGENKYKLMYDWYRSAIYSIFDGMEINQNWKIDISERHHIECTKQGGTRKQWRVSFSGYLRLEPFNWTP
jgi:hypothetical protein